MPTENKNTSHSRFYMLLFGGILPIVGFAIVEEFYGILWGAIVGMAFGVGEIIYEKVKFKKVSGVTWFSNFLILMLGSLSLVLADGIWFKLQPAIFMFFFAGMMLGSSILKKPILEAMAVKQNPAIPVQARVMLKAMNTRLSVVFMLLSTLLAWFALKWSTEAWAFLKSIGIFVILTVYLLGEIGFRKYLKLK